MKHYLGDVLMGFTFLAVMSALIILVGPLLALLVFLIAAAGGLVAWVGLLLTSL